MIRDEVTSIVRCNPVTGEKVITTGPSPITEEADAFISLQDQVQIENRDSDRSDVISS